MQVKIVSSIVGNFPSEVMIKKKNTDFAQYLKSFSGSSGLQKMVLKIFLYQNIWK
jgi:hypothetical protein